MLCACYIFKNIGVQCFFHEVVSNITGQLVNSSWPLEHWNYLGVDENLGPVAVSLRREKLDEHKEHGHQYNYRVIFRTSEVC